MAGCGNKRSMNKTVIIRADGSKSLGIGHVVRGISFASCLKEIGIKVIFAQRNYDSAAADLITREGFQVVSIEKESSFEDDAYATLKYADQYGTMFIFADISTASNIDRKPEYMKFYEIIQKAGKRVVMVDDIDKVDFPFDVHIIPYYEVEKLPYKRLDNTRYLLGCEYFMVSKHFSDIALQSRTINGKGKNIGLLMGGGDPNNVSAGVAQALSLINLPDLNVKVVIGSCFDCSMAEAIGGILKKSNLSFELYSNANMPELMLWSDIIITGGGLTKYEAALTGTPNIIVSQFNVEAERADDYASFGCAAHLGHIKKLTPAQMADNISALLMDYPKRKEMSLLGKKLIDGRGIERIIGELKRSNLI